jgi:hypothetical protein
VVLAEAELIYAGATMKRRHLLALPLLLALGPACNRWRPNRPTTLYFYDPLGAFDIAYATVQRMGYQVRVADPDRYHIEVASKIDEGDSTIALQIYSDARRVIGAYGKLVKEKKVHKKLEEEMQSIVAALRQSGQVQR